MMWSRVERSEVEWRVDISAGWGESAAGVIREQYIPCD